jgi:hypothetical protein
MVSLKVSLNHRPASARVPTAYYVYCVTFYSFDIPDSCRRHAMAGFPRSEREMWVWKRSGRDLLLKLDPEARWEKHEARQECGLRPELMAVRRQAKIAPPCRTPMQLLTTF